MKLLFRSHYRINVAVRLVLGIQCGGGRVSFRKLPPTNLILVAIFSLILRLLRGISYPDSLALLG